MLTREFPVGAYCTQECPEHWFHQDRTIRESANRSTCECTEADGRCKFSHRKLNHCEAAVCNSDVSWIFAEFSEGFVDDYASERNRIHIIGACIEMGDYIPGMPRMSRPKKS